MYTCIHVYMYMYICIYVDIDRKQDRDGGRGGEVKDERDREPERPRHPEKNREPETQWQRETDTWGCCTIIARLTRHQSCRSSSTIVAIAAGGNAAYAASSPAGGWVLARSTGRLSGNLIKAVAGTAPASSAAIAAADRAPVDSMSMCGLVWNMTVASASEHILGVRWRCRS